MPIANDVTEPRETNSSRSADDLQEKASEQRWVEEEKERKEGGYKERQVAMRHECR
jgi:hypothetical protein